MGVSQSSDASISLKSNSIERNNSRLEAKKPTKIDINPKRNVHVKF